MRDIATISRRSVLRAGVAGVLGSNLYPNVAKAQSGEFGLFYGTDGGTTGRLDSSGGSLWATTPYSGTVSGLDAGEYDNDIFTAGENGFVREIDADTGAVNWELDIGGVNRDVALHPDGNPLYVGSDSELVEIDRYHQYVNTVYTMENGRISTMDMSSSGSYLYIGDTAGNVTKLDPSDWGLVWQIQPGSSAIQDITVSPDGYIYVADDTDVFKYHNDSTQQWVYTQFAQPESIAVTPDSSSVGIGGSYDFSGTSFHLVNASDGSQVSAEFDRSIRALASDPSDSSVMYGSFEATTNDVRAIQEISLGNKVKTGWSYDTPGELAEAIDASLLSTPPDETPTPTDTPTETATETATETETATATETGSFIDRSGGEIMTVGLMGILLWVSVVLRNPLAVFMWALAAVTLVVSLVYGVGSILFWLCVVLTTIITVVGAIVRLNE